MKNIAMIPLLILGLSTLAQAEPPAKTPAAVPVASSASGKITAYTAGSHGELDGFILDNGTTIHFPAHAGYKVKPLLQKNQALNVDGTIQAGPAGQVLEASNIKNLVSGQSVNVSAIQPPVPLPPGAVSPPGMPPINPPNS
jgi:hypothetical protein